MTITPSNAGQHQRDSEHQDSARLLTPDTHLEPSVHVNLFVFKHNIVFNVKIEFKKKFELMEPRLNNYASARMRNEILLTFSSKIHSL